MSLPTSRTDFTRCHRVHQAGNLKTQITSQRPNQAATDEMDDVVFTLHAGCAGELRHQQKMVASMRSTRDGRGMGGLIHGLVPLG